MTETGCVLPALFVLAETEAGGAPPYQSGLQAVYPTSASEERKRRATSDIARRAGAKGLRSAVQWRRRGSLQQAETGEPGTCCRRDDDGVVVAIVPPQQAAVRNHPLSLVPCGVVRRALGGSSGDEILSSSPHTLSNLYLVGGVRSLGRVISHRFSWAAGYWICDSTCS